MGPGAQDVITHYAFLFLLKQGSDKIQEETKKFVYYKKSNNYNLTRAMTCSLPTFFAICKNNVYIYNEASSHKAKSITE